MAAKAAASEAGEPKPRAGRRKLLLLAAPLGLAAAGAGLWFSGILPGLLGHGAEEHHTEAAGEAPAASRSPVFFDMPEIVANLNATGRRASYIRLRSKLELSKPEDAAAVQAAMPRLLDLYSTYLREMRPEELRGSAGTQRLREELIARASLAAAPARVTDVLFVEILLQ
ncbi:flagellar basal body-associated FliL family protein [Roseicella aquatilis]|uniref:Flagellar protein FliL n=1 Tax=Roseicella aquatilis TaxID=2527868 RepID=A0A4R4DU38_9PROT|nr:flagellar basal body-associated FliL family protein [Roseicella aquatilis]TCZ63660.1 flagellar basal body protein FliL [Roseicella aquatilis]